jgi:hypothetical protein
MSMADRDRQLAADLDAERKSDQRKALIAVVLIAIIGVLTIVSDLSGAIGGVIPAIGRVVVGLVAVASAALVRFQPSNAWLLAMIWAVVQIPFYAWSPEGSPTSQAVQIPITMTNSNTVNGQLVSYSSIGVNLAGVIFAGWLKVWRPKFSH